jgi:hypothetical protein
MAKVLSFASYEMPHFIGPNNNLRLVWLLSDFRVAPFAFLTVAVGLLQPILMLGCWFRRKESAPGWAGMKTLVAGTIVLTWAVFLFTVREPWALTFYLTLPVAFLYSLYCYSFFVRDGRWLGVAFFVLCGGLVTNTALAVRNLHDRSLYLERGRPAAAIAERDYRILGERRAGTLY